MKIWNNLVLDWNHPSKAYPRGGFTLLETLVVIALIFILIGVLVVSGRAVFNYQRRATAQQHLAMVSRAIDQYAAFWPRWRAGATEVAEQGWPDFIPGRLFETNVFNTVPGFNDNLQFNINDLDRPITDLRGNGDALDANICLTYALTASAGSGPYIKQDDASILKDLEDPDLLRDIQQYGSTVTNPMYPALQGTASARRAQVLVDPWGTPYRFFWAYAASGTPPGPEAPRGFLPVRTADGGDAAFRVAEGYVLESAGPNRKFGNLWKLNPSEADFREAEDNLDVVP